MNLTDRRGRQFDLQGTFRRPGNGKIATGSKDKQLRGGRCLPHNNNKRVRCGVQRVRLACANDASDIAVKRNSRTSLAWTHRSVS